MIKYTYDATGNRIGKWVQVGAGTPKQTAYVRDASGNVMAIYEKGNSEVNGGLLSQIEVPLYGSSRLGVWRPDREVETTGWELFDTDPMTGTGGGIAGGWERGRVQFELSNHLGNVLVTISDVRIPVLMPEGIELCDDPVHPACYRPIDYYLPQVLTANDYYPFGMGMPGRKYSEGEYRYGFNGKEKDIDINSLTAYDYGFRIYNPAIGKFLSVDPLQELYPELTPYQFTSNSPIQGVDLDGREIYHYLLTQKDGKPILEYKGEQTHNAASWEIFDGPSDNWKSFDGDKITVKRVFVHEGSVQSEEPEYVFNYFKELFDWRDAGFPEKPKIDNSAAELRRNAVTTMMVMELTQQIDQADGDNDGYLNPNNYNSGKSTSSAKRSPSASTNKQATSANSGNEGAATSNTATAKVSTLKPGPYAKKSIPAKSTEQKFTLAERSAINKIGNEYGCHTCGAKIPGTKKENWIPDHQPSSAISPPGTPQVLFPHCLKCSQRQGGEVSAEKRRATTTKPKLKPRPSTEAKPKP